MARPALPIRHGTESGYANKCRCEECKEAHRERAAARRAAKREERRQALLESGSAKPERDLPTKPKPTGKPCALKGCSKPAIGDDYCSAECAQAAFGVVWRKISELDDDEKGVMRAMVAV